MIVIYYLILAHLMGDFVLQPNSLIKWKFKSWKGVLAHSSVITFLALILLSPYLINSRAWLLIILLALSHFAQDGLKVAYQKWTVQNSFLPFFVDQVLHIFFIWLFGQQIAALPRVGFSNTFEAYYSSENLLLFLSLAVFFSFTMDIVIYEIRKVRKPKLHYHRDTKGIWHRLAAFFIAYGLFLFLTLT